MSLGGGDQEGDADAADNVDGGSGGEGIVVGWVVDLGGIKGALEANAPFGFGGDGGGDGSGDGNGEKFGFAHEKSRIHDRCGG